MKSSTETAKAWPSVAADASEMRLDPRNRPVNRPAVVRACNREAWRRAKARSPWPNCRSAITLSKHQLLHSLPLSGTVVQTRSRQCPKRIDENIRGRQRKVSLQVSHSRLSEVLALQAPTKYELVVNLTTAKMLGLDLPAALR